MLIAINRITYWPAALLLAFLFISGCSQKEPQVFALAGKTMGTTYSVKWVAEDDANTTDLQAALDKELDAVNQAMSTYLPDSELSRFNQLPPDSEIEASEALHYVLSVAQEISRKSQGAFDITVGPLVNLWGFGPRGRVLSAPDPDKIDRLRARVGYQKLSISSKGTQVRKDADLYVDLSSIAKGYGVDAMAAVLEARGINNYLVEIGGELRTKGQKPQGRSWQIAIESPLADGSRQVQKVVSLDDIAVATSGDYRNYFEENGVRYSHTIDPATGSPIDHRLASVTVLRPTCTEADGLATALMVMGEESAYQFALDQQLDILLIIKTEQGFIEKMTPGFARRVVE